MIKITKLAKTLFEKLVTNPDERYQVSVDIGDGKEANFYGKDEKEACKKAAHYQKHYLTSSSTHRDT